MSSSDIPGELDGAEVLKFAEVTLNVRATGATRHIVGGAMFGPARALAIAQYDGDDGTYLFYLDDAGQVVTDTWHLSVEDALDQAEFEYEGLRWIDAAEA